MRVLEVYEPIGWMIEGGRNWNVLFILENDNGIFISNFSSHSDIFDSWKERRKVRDKMKDYDLHVEFSLEELI
jgi:hypothetical protein